MARKPRSEHLEALRRGTLSLRSIRTADGAERLRLREALEAIPGIGPARVEQITDRAGVAPWLEFRDMTAEQVERVVGALPPKAREAQG
jgi:ribosomal protein S13